MDSSKPFVSRFFPPNSDPRPPLVLGLALSLSLPVLGAMGVVDLRLGAKASLSFPTGDTPRLFVGTSGVLVRRAERSSEEAKGSTSVT